MDSISKFPRRRAFRGEENIGQNPSFVISQLGDILDRKDCYELKDIKDGTLNCLLNACGAELFQDAFLNVGEGFFLWLRELLSYDFEGWIACLIDNSSLLRSSL